jgi:hypothetical protein
MMVPVNVIVQSNEFSISVGHPSSRERHMVQKNCVGMGAGSRIEIELRSGSRNHVVEKQHCVSHGRRGEKVIALTYHRKLITNQ